MTSLKSAVHVEVSLKSGGNLKKHDVVGAVKEKLRTCCPIFANGPVDLARSEELKCLCEYILVCDLDGGRPVSFWQAQLCIHAFSLSDQEPEKDFLEGEGELPASEQWELPNRLLCGLWDSIIIEDAIKKQLLGYCSTSIRFADAGVDPSIISWNRMALLHGPPGLNTALARQLPTMSLNLLIYLFFSDDCVIIQALARLPYARHSHKKFTFATAIDTTLASYSK